MSTNVPFVLAVLQEETMMLEIQLGRFSKVSVRGQMLLHIITSQNLERNDLTNRMTRKQNGKLTKDCKFQRKSINI